MKRTLTVLFSLVLVFGLSNIANAKGAGGAGKGKKKETTRGVITSVTTDAGNAATGSIVVKAGGGKKAGQAAAAEEKTFTVGAATTITVDGANGTLADLKAKDHVTVTSAAGAASKIDAKHPKGKGNKAGGGKKNK